MSETNNLNQSFNSDSHTNSMSKAEMNNNPNSDESKLESFTDLSNLAVEKIANSENSLPPKDNSQEVQKPKDIDWHKLAHKLREHNRKLLKKVFQLEQEVAETNNRIKEYSLRSESTDMLIAQQAEEINHDREEIAHIIQELETSQQEIHSQKILVDSLNKQLETANENFAKLERESALLQEKYNNQTHDLSVKNQQIQELSARLHRQQRYTLQYKAALDKYLDVNSSTPLAETKIDSDLLPIHPQPIQAWSNFQATQETSSIKSSNLGIQKENHPLESELKLTSKNSKEANWPSPLINTVNSGKKPKSLAAVELPKFEHSDSVHS